jgi:hypothetical protein
MVNVVRIPAAIAPKTQMDKGKAGDRIPKKTNCIGIAQLESVKITRIPGMASSSKRRTRVMIAISG